MSTVLPLLVFPMGLQVNNSDTTVHVSWNGTIKQMDGRWWESYFALQKCEFTEKQEEVIRVVIVEIYWIGNFSMNSYLV